MPNLVEQFSKFEVPGEKQIGDEMRRLIDSLQRKTTNPVFLSMVFGLMAGGLIAFTAYGGYISTEKAISQQEEKIEDVHQKHRTMTQNWEYELQTDNTFNKKNWLVANTKKEEPKKAKEVEIKKEPKKPEIVEVKKIRANLKKKLLRLKRLKFECPETNWAYLWEVTEEGTVVEEQEKIEWLRIEEKSLSNTKPHKGYFFEQ